MKRARNLAARTAGGRAPGVWSRSRCALCAERGRGTPASAPTDREKESPFHCRAAFALSRVSPACSETLVALRLLRCLSFSRLCSLWFTNTRDARRTFLLSLWIPTDMKSTLLGDYKVADCLLAKKMLAAYPVYAGNHPGRADCPYPCVCAVHPRLASGGDPPGFCAFCRQ